MQLHCYFKFMFLTEWTLQGQVSSPGLQRADAIKQTGLCSCCIWNNPSESCCAVHGAEKAALSPLVPQETHIQKWHSILIVLWPTSPYLLWGGGETLLILEFPGKLWLRYLTKISHFYSLYFQILTVMRYINLHLLALFFITVLYL